MIFFAFLLCLLLPKTRKTPKKEWFKKGSVCIMFVLVAPSSGHHEMKMASPEMPVLKAC